MKRLAVFAKPPAPGRVKTRLSPALPERLACDLYRAMLADALAAASGAGAHETLVFWAPGEAAGVPSIDATPRATARFQRGADLGERLASAFGELLGTPDDRAVILGADCPALGAETIGSAFRELETHDLVLGPTRDGGYYLVGLRRPYPALFAGVSWSTARVLGETLERAQGARLDTVLLGSLDDLDTPADLVRTLAAAASGTAFGSATRRALHAMGLLPGARAAH